MNNPDLNHDLPASSGIELYYPNRLNYPIRAWLGHVPFAFWIVEALRPRVIVELGVHSGNSYCAFLQAAHSLGLACRCFGIDHWQGEEHSGRYGEEVYAELSKYHDQRYAGFSTLLRCPFNEAVKSFSDATIDLLHLDGCHTYEAASGDFANWLPKMSSRGVMLFHDTNAREKDFGVWRLWEEIASRYPNFEFINSHGLGVAYVGSEPLNDQLAPFFASNNTVIGARLRIYFARLGNSIIDRYKASEMDQILQEKQKAMDQISQEKQAESARADKAMARIEELEGEIATILTQTAQFKRAAAEAEANAVFRMKNLARSALRQFPFLDRKVRQIVHRLRLR